VDFHEALHWNLILDSGMKNTHTEKKAAAKEKDPGNKDQYGISREERGDTFEDNGEDETRHHDASPEDHFHLPE
jgi:hypothetical protein